MAELPTWKDINFACIVFEPGNARNYLTGDWRSMRPERVDSKCVKCGECWMYCPDAAIFQDERGFYAVDYDYCKGCGICAKECAHGAIVMVEECE